MSDYGDQCRELKDAKRRVRARYGIPCPECERLLPKASPTILLPGHSCNKRGHKYKDPRTHEPKANQFIEAGYTRVRRSRRQRNGPDGEALPSSP
jgi:hypothetical protein